MRRLPETARSFATLPDDSGSKSAVDQVKQLLREAFFAQSTKPLAPTCALRQKVPQTPRSGPAVELLARPHQ
eukprot:8928497-Alexandrium_andersonii.AAC.1